MIDLKTESLISLHEAARSLPSNRAGKSVNLSTVFRWIQKGVTTQNGRVRLEAIRLGGRWLTSWEAPSDSLRT